jgi:hypothetical protein
MLGSVSKQQSNEFSEQVYLLDARADLCKTEHIETEEIAMVNG